MKKSKFDRDFDEIMKKAEAAKPEDIKVYYEPKYSIWSVSLGDNNLKHGVYQTRDTAGKYTPHNMIAAFNNYKDAEMFVKELLNDFYQR